MKCIVGLGNPGRKYKETRHNVGFMAIDTIASSLGVKLDEKKFNCRYAITMWRGEKVLFIEPQTFMNLSGEGVRPLIDYYKIAPEDVLVIFDDLDLPTGKIRLREKGGHGGHNGIRSLIQHLATKEFKRIRIGIGRPIEQMAVVDYVLQKFSKQELRDIADAIDNTAKAVETYVADNFNSAMNKYNG